MLPNKDVFRLIVDGQHRATSCGGKDASSRKPAELMEGGQYLSVPVRGLLAFLRPTKAKVQDQSQSQAS